MSAIINKGAVGTEPIWQDRARLTFFALPWTFTKYTLLEDKLKIDSGLLTRKHDDVRLYRVLDVSVEETLIQRIFGLGNLHIKSSDKSLGDFTMKNIKGATDVSDAISEAAEAARKSNKVSTREFIGNDSTDDNIDE